MIQFGCPSDRLAWHDEGMPIVTALRRPQSRSGAAATRIVVEIDGEPLATCSDMLIGEFGLRAGRELDQDDLDLLTRRIGETEAIRAAGRLLSQRLMTRSELEKKLSGRQLSPEVVDAALARLEADGYIDDHRYAELFVQSRTARGLGHMRIRADLAKRGVERNIVDEVLKAPSADSESGPELRQSQVQQLVTMVERKYKTADWSDRKSVDRAARYLASRGHGWDVIGPVLDQVRLGPESDAQ